MSVLPPVTDLIRLYAQVRKGPDSYMVTLLDHLVGATEESEGEACSAAVAMGALPVDFF
jgi:hypothetical protein